MASTGPNTTQSLYSFICPSVTLSLSHLLTSFCGISHSIVSLCSYTPLSLCSLCLLLTLCSFFYPNHCFSICALPASFYLSHSLAPSFAASLHPSILYPAGAEQPQWSWSDIPSTYSMDSTEGHKSWVFWSAHPGFFKFYIVRKGSMELMYEVPLLYLQFHAKYLAFLSFLQCQTLPPQTVSLSFSVLFIISKPSIF